MPDIDSIDYIMKRLILTTILADLAGCLTTGVMLLFDKDISLLPFVLIFTFGNILIPTLIAALIYQQIKQMSHINQRKTLILHSVTMTLISLLAIIIWTIIDTFYSFGLKDLTFIHIKNDFRTQFSGFIPATMSVALTIPFIDHFLTNKLLTIKADNLSPKWNAQHTTLGLQQVGPTEEQSAANLYCALVWCDCILILFWVKR